MKPNFALSFSDDGISLLHRVPAGWRSLGEAPLDASDLGAQMAQLRAQAESLDPEGARCKLVIPNDQVKYLRISAQASSDDHRRQIIHDALREATPYEVEDLAYDWRIHGDMILIAAVARETLAEAEQFALGQKFAPVSYVAIAPRGRFVGEPFFGATAYARNALPAHQAIEPDLKPIILVPDSLGSGFSNGAVSGRGNGKVSAPVVPPADAGEVTEPVEEAEAVDDTPAAVPSEPEDAPAPVTFSSVRSRPRSEPRGGGASVAASSIAPPSAETLEPRLMAAPPPHPVVQPVTAPRSEVANGDTRRAAAIASLRQQPKPIAPPPLRAPVAGAAPAPSEKDKPAVVAAAGASLTATPQKAPSNERQKMTVFGARKAEPQVVGGKPRYLGLILTTLLILFLAAVAAYASVYFEPSLARLWAKPQQEPAIAELSLPEEITTAPADPAPVPQEAEVLASLPAASAADVLADLPPVRDLPVAEVAAVPAQAQSPALPHVVSPERSATLYAVSGIMQSAPVPPPQPFGGEDVNVALASLDLPPNAHAPVSLTPFRAFAEDAALAPRINPPAPQTRYEYDENGQVVATPAGALTPQGILVYAGKPARVPPARPAYGDGAVAAATPNTAAAPKIAKIRPRARPGLEVEVARAEVADTLIATPAENIPEPRSPQPETGAPAQEDAAEVARLRPRARPVLPDEVADRTESLLASVATDASLANPDRLDTPPRDSASAEPNGSPARLRPRARPQALAIAAQVVVAPAPKTVTPPAITPRARPTIKATLMPKGTIVPQAAPKPRARPESIAQPKPRSKASPAPRLPSSASVARQATQSNILNLRKINLIGVSGPAAQRRALVRLKNGNYKELRVGDRLDGGRVSAISDTQLRYKKGRRNIVLKMPRG